MNPDRKSKNENLKFLLCVLCVLCGEWAVPRAGEAPEAEEKKANSPEEVVRQRFLVAYQTAQTAETKAETVEMLRGLKEEASLRLLTGMLGNSHAIVRRTACTVMAATPDSQGYFVKPLMGMLYDPSPSVRIAAAEALGNASVHGQAIKALAFALVELAGAATARNSADAPRYTEAYDSALQKLTGEKTDAKDVRDISSFWMDYWKKNGEEILRKEKPPEVEPPPRPANLPKDSLGK